MDVGFLCSDLKLCNQIEIMVYELCQLRSPLPKLVVGADFKGSILFFTPSLWNEAINTQEFMLFIYCFMRKLEVFSTWIPHDGIYIFSSNILICFADLFDQNLLLEWFISCLCRYRFNKMKEMEMSLNKVCIRQSISSDFNVLN